MTRFVKLASLGALALAAISSTTAFAADLPSRKAPVPYVEAMPVFTWTGFYVGLNAGAAIRSGSNNNNGFNPFFPVAFGNNGGGNKVAFIGGGQLGYNWQSGPIVWGLEADADYRSGFGGNNNNVFGGGNTNNGGFLGTARGRLGYLLTPSLLAYVTGGAAFGNTWANNNGFNAFFLNNGNNNSFRVGYTVGGGLEYMINNAWSIKAEYLFADLGKNSQNFNFFNNGSSRSQAHIVRAGINYHFNTGVAAPVVARY